MTSRVYLLAIITASLRVGHCEHCVAIARVIHDTTVTVEPAECDFMALVGLRQKPKVLEKRLR